MADTEARFMHCSLVLTATSSKGYYYVPHFNEEGTVA